MDEALLAKYLGILGLRARRPDLDFLREIVSSHLARVPFENVSKVHWLSTRRLASLPDLRLYLDGIADLGFGGTCYATNYHLYRLLEQLGFEVRLCGADMSRPDVHVVVLVRVEGREYLVDAGYAAPFREPIPADLTSDHVVSWGGDRYVLSPKDGSGRRRMVMFREGIAKHGYVVNPAPRRIEHFESVIAASFRPEATFLNSLLLARFPPGRSVAIRNLSIVEADAAGSTTRRLRDRPELARTIESLFGIPAAIAEAVLDDLPKLADPWD